MPRLRNFDLTTKLLVLVSVLALTVWFISDIHQTRNLSKIFQAKLTEQLSQQSRVQRTLFDRHVKSYSQMAKLLAGTQALHRYLDGVEWDGAPARVLYHDATPRWLPDHSVLRKFILPRYVLLLDRQDRLREFYHWNNGELPTQLRDLPSYLLQLARNQSYLTQLKGQPFLLTAEPILERGRPIATLVLASPLDSEFLNESQTQTTLPGAVALLAEDGQTIMVSSDPSLIPGGARLSELEHIYRTIGEGFFDYGSTDLVIKFVSFVSVEEVRDMTEAVLSREHTSRLITTAVYTLTFILIMLYMTRRLKRLSNRVVDFSRRMSIPQPDFEIKDELQILEQRFKLLANAIKSETEALEYQASHDPLTDLPNRKKLNERLQSELLRSQNSGEPLVLFVSDLNHFKEINDTLGHHIGDLVLQQAAERLYHTVRRTDTVARLGGDEFSILLPRTSIDQAMRVAGEIVDIFNVPFVVEGHNLNVGISIGIVESPQHGDDVNILMQRADVAMYTAKRNNLGYTIYNPDKDEHHVSRLALMSELHEAIENEVLELYYQAKMDIKSNRLLGVEALLRWQHPQRGFIEPDEFIPLAEQTGLIKPLTYWVLRQSLAQCAAWNRRGHDISISINISAQCLYDDMLTRTLRSQLKKHDLNARNIILELTESDIMSDPMRAKYVLSEIRAIGASISIDDFGTGYSSLAYLKQLPVSEIKIDRSFVIEMLEDDNDKAIVQTIINLGHNLDLKVVAEGVESDDAYALLNQQDCDIAQGYFINRPVSAAEFETGFLNKKP
jgi:diguanylate cyclase (GGDEF)-like protein